METRIVLYLILMIVSLLLAAFFCSSETAFISLQKIRIKHLETTGDGKAKRIAKLIANPGRLLSTTLLGVNFTETAIAVLGTAIVVSLWGERVWGERGGLLIATIAITVITLLFAEAIPKTIAVHHAEKIAFFNVRPLEVISRLLYPFTVAISWLGSVFTKAAGGPPIPRSLVSEEEIRSMITVGQREGTVEQEAAEMIHKVFKFGDRPVREVMTPRTDIVWVEQGMTVRDFLSVFSQGPHSRFPVYTENRDDVTGVLSIKDLLMAQAKGEVNDQSVIDMLVRPATFVPGNKLVGELLSDMQASGSLMAIVVDEFGGISGLVTLEQLVEEIVGEVKDELSIGIKDFEAIDERTFEVDGTMRIEEAKEQLGLELPEGDYETVAGFVLSRLGHIPKTGEHFKYQDMKLTVTEMRGMKLEKVLITRE